MAEEGPLLEVLTRRLAECPEEFLAEPRVGTVGTIHVAAVVGDLMLDLGGSPLPRTRAGTFRTGLDRKGKNRLRCILVACWLLHDGWFRARRRFAEPALRFLAEGLNELAALVDAPRLVTDPDRREELARLCLEALGLRPAGETAEQAEDRLTTLSSVERERVIRASRAAENRAAELREQAVREAMARRAAEEAAARYSPE
ncbi:MAG: hypothetical protein L0Z62_33185 [Gemmataceae bacterium]|nr:hypothetical protein [Gemmataceae bacterium]